MKAVREIYSFTQNVVGQEQCEVHNKTYNLIETPGGIVGNCPDCFKEKIQKEDEKVVEKAIENKFSGWQDSLIKKFEKVSSDLEAAKIRTYKPEHETQKKAKEMAIDYIKSFDKKKSLLLSGAPGRGKSHIAYSITKGLRQQGYKTLFIKSTNLLDLFRSTYEDGSQLTEERIFKLIESLDLLVLDDFGAEYLKSNEYGFESWGSDMLYKVLESRLNKSIVCTTNYTTSELKKKYGNHGERIISRMGENAKAIRLDGEDHRLKNFF